MGLPWQRLRTEVLLATSRWESLLGKSKRCLGSPPLLSQDQSLMALPASWAPQLQQSPHPQTKRNLVFSKPCSLCSSPPPTPPPQRRRRQPPSVVVFLEVASLAVPAMPRPPRRQLPQPPPPPNAVVSLEGDFFARKMASY